MKYLKLIAIFYCIVHASNQDIPVVYEGMDKSTIARLIGQTYENAKFEFVKKAAYDALLAKRSPQTHNY